MHKPCRSRFVANFAECQADMDWVCFIALFTSHISLTNLHFMLYIDTQIFVCLYVVSFLFLSVSPLCCFLAHTHLFLYVSFDYSMFHTKPTIHSLTSYQGVYNCKHTILLTMRVRVFSMTKIELESIESVNSIFRVAAYTMTWYSSIKISLVLCYIHI